MGFCLCPGVRGVEGTVTQSSLRPQLWLAVVQTELGSPFNRSPTSDSGKPEFGASFLNWESKRVTLPLPLCFPLGLTMEFPGLGKHCSEETCKQLDFLPLKCDTCEREFCKDHFAYAAHKCPFAFKKDVQVPVCPLCDRPIPVKKGEIPDAVVSNHIDRDCKLRPRKEKIFTYRCSRGGCKKKEMLPVACDQCGSNFCLQHRHPLDHSCARGRIPISLPG